MPRKFLTAAERIALKRKIDRARRDERQAAQRAQNAWAADVRAAMRQNSGPCG